VPSRESRRWKHFEESKTLRDSRKQMKRNRKPKTVRRKDWMELVDADSLDEMEQVGVLQDERIMPRGDGERRRAAPPAAVREQGENDASGPAADDGRRQGVVVQVSTALCRVAIDGYTVLCHLRGSLSSHETGFTNVVAVGDRVLVSGAGAERGVVEVVLPRQSVLARPDVFHSHLQQVIVANVDQLLIVAAWRNPHVWLELIDRYLIVAERNNLLPIICINKIDLADDRSQYQAVLRPYLDLGYRVLFTSAEHADGLDEVRSVLGRRTTVLAGMSGVGKSTLLTQADIGLQLRTGIVSEAGGEGRHTTTQVSMWPLEGGGFVVDTPGIREFGLSGLRQCDLSRFYPEIRAVEGACQFRDCSHTREPGCAVREALEQGRLSSDRYHNYRVIRDSLPA
jgi:ribosome biogenesis GTPase / thiamine phosphate phosphatase